MKKNHVSGHYVSNVWRKTFMVMKLSIFLILLGILSVSAEGFGQGGTISLKMEDASLEDILQELKSHSDYTFVYSDQQVEDITVGLFEVNDANLEVVMDICLQGTDLDYYVENNVVVIHKKDSVIEQPIKQEKIILKGTVTDENGEPIPFASVCFKGTTNGCVAALDGKFELEMDADPTAVLVVSCIGYVSIELPIGDKREFTIKLESATQGLDEVVVTGYQTISKERATGSFQIVNADDLDNVASLDVASKLQGVSPGVRVDDNGEIVIRGQATLSANKTPFIVVNGLPFNGNLSDINSDDIEQITVLKDAASTSIYGVRGANGVIVITTKNGNTDGKLNVSYTNNLQFSEKAKMSDLHQLNSRDYADLEWENYEKVGLVSYPWYSYKSEVGEIYDRFQNNVISEEEAKSELSQLASYDNARDIEKEFMQRVSVQKHTLSFNYGTKKNQFYASVSYDEDKSMWKGTNGNNISFNLNDRFKFNDILALSVNAFGNFRKKEMNGEDVSNMRPYVRFKDENGNLVSEARGSYDVTQRADFEGMGLLPFFYNRLQERDLNDKEEKSSSISTNAKLDIMPTDWLTLSASLGYNVTDGRSENFQNKESNAARRYVNKFTVSTPSGLNQLVPYGHILRYDDNHSENLTTRIQANVKKQINDFNFGLNAGWERNTFKEQNNLNNIRFNYHKQRLTESQVNFKDLTGGIYNAMGGYAQEYNPPSRSQSEFRYQSVYFIGNVSYKGKYNLSGSWRLDKTNLFGQSPKYRDQPAWSVGTKWSLSEEDFFDVEWINSLGVKLSYGLAGNVDRSTSPFLIGYSYNDFITNEAALDVANPENPQLGWEKTYTTNIGIDYALFNNRINGSIEFYNKHSKDVLANVSLDPTNGFAQVKMNNGEIINRGLDVAVNARLVEGVDFSYDLGLNFSYNHNEITKINVNSSTRAHLHRGFPIKGQAVDYLYGYKSAGVDETGEPLVYGPNGEIPWQGMNDFELEDGTFFGRKTPPVFGSITQHFKYKNFSADIFVLYDLGHYVKKYNNPYVGSDSGVGALPDILTERWRIAGDEKTKKLAKLDNTPYSANDRDAAIWESDISIDKADVVQLKSINLSYDFTSMLNSKMIKGLKLKVGIENLWHWTATDNNRVYDRMQGFPRYKNYTMGLSMQF